MPDHRDLAETKSISSDTSVHRALESLWTAMGLPSDALARLDLSGEDPALPSSFRIGTAAVVPIAAAALAAAELHRLRTGFGQRVAVDMQHACAEFRSERFVRVNGETPPSPWDKIAGAYRCGDGRWIRIHTNFPDHRDGILELLGCDYDRASVAAAFAGWEAERFEDAATGAGMIAAVERSAAEWRDHPQARAAAGLPLLAIDRLGSAPVEPLLPGDRPLTGVRVLDLTRIVAGPVAGRTLAAHGATVLRVLGRDVPTVETLDIDNGRGKLSAAIDLKTAAGRAALEDLIAGADVFLQSYRPGALDALGFGAERVAAMRPGIVQATLSAYQPIGPWRTKRGFDSIVQTATGFNRDEGEASGSGEPTALPAQSLDHGSGHLLAFGVIAALLRRHREGGSWYVVTSLAQVGEWLRSLGRVENGFDMADPSFDDAAPFLEETDSGWGRLLAVRHAAVMSLTPARWEAASMPYGSHLPQWPDRPGTWSVAE